MSSTPPQNDSHPGGRPSHRWQGSRCHPGPRRLPPSDAVMLPKHSQRVTLEIPEAWESAYRIDDDELTSTGSLLGAGVLPFTVHPETGVVYFLLGKEHFVAGWRGSNCWSAFEGGVKSADTDVFHTASREYLEESLGVLHATCTKKDIRNFAHQLREEEDYALRVTLCILSEDNKRPPRFHVTFVRYFEWREELAQTFRHRRYRLIDLSRRLGTAADREGQQRVVSDLSEGERDHAAIVTRGEGETLEVAGDFLEKAEVRLFSANEMADVILHRNIRQDMFRSCFVRTMGVVLQEFGRRLSFKGMSEERRD